MIYGPIIKAHQKKFVEAFELSKCSDSEAFEKFANYTELLQHQPDAFSSDMELLDTVSGGTCRHFGKSIFRIQWSSLSCI